MPGHVCRLPGLEGFAKMGLLSRIVLGMHLIPPSAKSSGLRASSMSLAWRRDMSATRCLGGLSALPAPAPLGCQVESNAYPGELLTDPLGFPPIKERLLARL